MRRLILFLRTMSDPIISAYNHIIYETAWLVADILKR